MKLKTYAKKQAAALQRSSLGEMSARESQEYEERETQIAMLEARLQKANPGDTFIWR